MLISIYFLGSFEFEKLQTRLNVNVSKSNGNWFVCKFSFRYLVIMDWRCADLPSSVCVEICKRCKWMWSCNVHDHGVTFT